MYFGICGHPGSGKTLFASVFGLYLSTLYKVPVKTVQYSLRYADRLTHKEQMFAARDCILIVDEMPDLLDSRLFKGNVEITRWINKLRKRNVILIYTAQDFGDVDLRLRNRTQFLVVADQPEEGVFKYVLTNLRRLEVKPRYYVFPGLQEYYTYYDTREYSDAITNLG